jgi:hypothetical protein
MDNEFARATHDTQKKLEVYLKNNYNNKLNS